VELRTLSSEANIQFELTFVFNIRIMATTITIGVLALQGAFSEHLQLLRKAFATIEAEEGSTKVDWKDIEVRTEEQLSKCDALIVPGGESTAISLVAERSGLLEPLRSFVKYVDMIYRVTTLN